MRDMKTPAYAVLITFFEPFYKVGTGIGCFRLSASRPAQEKADMHTTIKDKVPRSKMLAQKQMLITHIAGADKTSYYFASSIS